LQTGKVAAATTSEEKQQGVADLLNTALNLAEKCSEKEPKKNDIVGLFDKLSSDLSEMIENRSQLKTVFLENPYWNAVLSKEPTERNVMIQGLREQNTTNVIALSVYGSLYRIGVDCIQDLKKQVSSYFIDQFRLIKEVNTNILPALEKLYEMGIVQKTDTTKIVKNSGDADDILLTMLLKKQNLTKSMVEENGTLVVPFARAIFMAHILATLMESYPEIRTQFLNADPLYLGALLMCPDEEARVAYVYKVFRYLGSAVEMCDEFADALMSLSIYKLNEMMTDLCTKTITCLDAQR
jgi:hypothetical protein